MIVYNKKPVSMIDTGFLLSIVSDFYFRLISAQVVVTLPCGSTGVKTSRN